MACWLLKSEPETWSWADQEAAGTAQWDGVRNAQALNAMRKMAEGDLGLFYHSGKARRIVGMVRVVRPFYPDPDDPKSGLVDVAAVRPLPEPVTLAAIKADGRFAHLALVRQPRLSVMPVDDESFRALCALGGVAP